MKEISCTDLGCCDHVVSAPDDKSLKTKLYEHAASMHPDMVKTMAPNMAAGLDVKIAQYTRTV